MLRFFLTKGVPGNAAVNVNDVKRCGNNTPAKFAEDLTAIDSIFCDAELEKSDTMYGSHGKWKNATPKC